MAILVSENDLDRISAWGMRDGKIKAPSEQKVSHRGSKESRIRFGNSETCFQVAKKCDQNWRKKNECSESPNDENRRTIGIRRGASQRWPSPGPGDRRKP